MLRATSLIQLQEQVSARERGRRAGGLHAWRSWSKTRAHESLALGVSPRGAQALYRATQALALMEGRDYVIPDDVKRLAVPVFAHRVAIKRARRSRQRQHRTERAHPAGDSHAGGGSARDARAYGMTTTM